MENSFSKFIFDQIDKYFLDCSTGAFFHGKFIGYISALISLDVIDYVTYDFLYQ